MASRNTRNAYIYVYIYGHIYAREWGVNHKNSRYQLNVRKQPGDLEITHQSKIQLTLFCTTVTSSVRGGRVVGNGSVLGS